MNKFLLIVVFLFLVTGNCISQNQDNKIITSLKVIGKGNANNDSIYVINFSNGGGMFMPSKLPAGKEITFYGIIRTLSNTKNKIFRFGFVDFRYCALLNPKLKQEKLKQKIYWSDKVYLESEKVFSKEASNQFETKMSFWTYNK